MFCVLTSLGGDSNFTITDENLYATILTLLIKNNAKLSELLSKGFERLVYWNKYKIISNKKP